jgi:hypothetical protein
MQPSDADQLSLVGPGNVPDIPQADPFGDPRARRHLRLLILDRTGVDPVIAVARAPMPTSHTYASPAPAICSNNNIYWLKRRAQGGLLTELVAGRLAAKLSVGPEACVVMVPPGLATREPTLARFDGMNVGTRHVPNAQAARNLAELIGTATFGPRSIDAESRGAVITFQTWLHVEDAQVLIGLADGRVQSFDHGDSLDALLRGKPAVVVTKIPGVSDDLGRAWHHIEPALRRIEDLPEEEILASVACVPDEDYWRGQFHRRIAIAEWLIKRRQVLREVMWPWARRAS